MEIDVNVRERILKPVPEVFQAVVDPVKMSNYFISSARLVGLLKREKQSSGSLRMLRPRWRLMSSKSPRTRGSSTSQKPWGGRFAPPYIHT